jgi:hypothetical protein
VQDWQTQGSHFYRVDGDFIRWRLHGPIELEDLRLMFEVWARVAQAYGGCMTVLDVRDGVSLSAQARHYVGQRSRTVPLKGSTAIVGASFMLRTIVTLLQNASRLLGRALPMAYFCNTLEEADDWIAKERELSHSQPHA